MIKRKPENQTSKSDRGRRGMRAVLLVVALAAVGCSGLRAQEARPHASVLNEFSVAVEELCSAVSPAVVEIEVQTRAPIENAEGRRAGFFADQKASGSGVILDPSGYIMTNAHVVDGARDIDVSVSSAIGRAAAGDAGATREIASGDTHKHYTAHIVGVDRETDLAVVKIDAANLPTLGFRDSDKLRQGQIVFALGSPLGLENTLTVGYVSAMSRQLKADQPMFYIQTDAPINPGNSGGPLLDIDGKIAGINTMIYTQSGGSEGIGFAIPANIARHVYEQLRTEGHIHRGTIGVVTQDITQLMSDALGIDHHPGVILSDVIPHGAAEAAGLEAGDVVVAVDGRTITQARQMQAELLQRAIGDQLKIDVLRGGKTLQKTVAIVERPKSPLALADLVSSGANLVRELGILAMTLDEKVTPSLPETRRLYGVVVAAIPAEYAAFNPGLTAGDVIYSLNKTKVESLDRLRTALKSLKPGDPAVLLVESGGTLGYVAFKIE